MDNTHSSLNPQEEISIRQYLTKMVSLTFQVTWSGQGVHMARQVTMFMKLAASFKMFKRGWGRPGRGLTRSLHKHVIFRVQLGLISCEYLSLTIYVPVSIVW